RAEQAVVARGIGFQHSATAGTVAHAGHARPIGTLIVRIRARLDAAARARAVAKPGHARPLRTFGVRIRVGGDRRARAVAATGLRRAARLAGSRAIRVAADAVDAEVAAALDRDLAGLADTEPAGQPLELRARVRGFVAVGTILGLLGERAGAAAALTRPGAVAGIGRGAEEAVVARLTRGLRPAGSIATRDARPRAGRVAAEAVDAVRAGALRVHGTRPAVRDRAYTEGVFPLGESTQTLSTTATAVLLTDRAESFAPRRGLGFAQAQ